VNIYSVNPGYFFEYICQDEGNNSFKTKEMSSLVVKVMDLVGESNTSWDHAVKAAVEQASQSTGNITGVEVSNLTAGVNQGRISEYKANVRVAYTE
jgi:flavin-binding protein dodecin